MPAVPRRAPHEVLERQAARARTGLAALSDAIRRGAVGAALDAGEQLLLLLSDEDAAGLLSPKAAAGVLDRGDVQALLAPLAEWSDEWPDPARDSIGQTLTVLEPLVERCNEQFDADESLIGGAPPRGRDPEPPVDAIRRAFDVLVHSPIEAVLFNRGLHTRLLWDRGHVARLIANLQFVAATRGTRPVPTDAESRLTDGRREELARSIRRLRPGTADAVRAFGAAEARIAFGHNVRWPPHGWWPTFGKWGWFRREDLEARP